VPATSRLEVGHAVRTAWAAEICCEEAALLAAYGLLEAIIEPSERDTIEGPSMKARHFVTILDYRVLRIDFLWIKGKSVPCSIELANRMDIWIDAHHAAEIEPDAQE
jgi:hypothetical protein